jgi:hypothetical protein
MILTSTWRDSYNRGAGIDTGTCPDPLYPNKGTDRNCYENCPATYTPDMNDINCYGPCPYNYVNGITICTNTGPYWRPGGYLSFGLC